MSFREASSSPTLWMLSSAIQILGGPLGRSKAGPPCREIPTGRARQPQAIVEGGQIERSRDVRPVDLNCDPARPEPESTKDPPPAHTEGPGRTDPPAGRPSHRDTRATIVAILS